MTLFKGNTLLSAFGPNVYIQFSQKIVEKDDGLMKYKQSLYISLNKTSEYHDVNTTQWKVL